MNMLLLSFFIFILLSTPSLAATQETHATVTQTHLQLDSLYFFGPTGTQVEHHRMNHKRIVNWVEYLLVGQMEKLKAERNVDPVAVQETLETIRSKQIDLTDDSVGILLTTLSSLTNLPRLIIVKTVREAKEQVAAEDKNGKSQMELKYYNDESEMDKLMESLLSEAEASDLENFEKAVLEAKEHVARWQNIHRHLPFAGHPPPDILGTQVGGEVDLHLKPVFHHRLLIRDIIKAARHKTKEDRSAFSNDDERLSFYLQEILAEDASRDLRGKPYTQNIPLAVMVARRTLNLRNAIYLDMQLARRSILMDRSLPFEEYGFQSIITYAVETADWEVLEDLLGASKNPKDHGLALFRANHVLGDCTRKIGRETQNSNCNIYRKIVTSLVKFLVDPIQPKFFHALEEALKLAKQSKVDEHTYSELYKLKTEL